MSKLENIAYLNYLLEFRHNGESHEKTVLYRKLNLNILLNESLGCDIVLKDIVDMNFKLSNFEIDIKRSIIDGDEKNIKELFNLYTTLLDSKISYIEYVEDKLNEEE